MPADQTRDLPVLIGRSSSHFTRVTRIFAAELEVAYGFEVVPDITARDPAIYGGNPALKVPVLKTEQGSWFGALNVCRELARRARRGARIVWPEALDLPLLANAQELVVQSMSTGVSLVMARAASAGAGGSFDKFRLSLQNSVAWLDAQVDQVLAALPAERELSHLEVSLFCLVEHLEFREILPTAPYPALIRFCRQFARRPSAQATPYRFDT